MSDVINCPSLRLTMSDDGATRGLLHFQVTKHFPPTSNSRPLPTNYWLVNGKFCSKLQISHSDFAHCTFFGHHYAHCDANSSTHRVVLWVQWGLGCTFVHLIIIIHFACLILFFRVREFGKDSILIFFTNQTIIIIICYYCLHSCSGGHRNAIIPNTAPQFVRGCLNTE